MTSLLTSFTEIFTLDSARDKYVITGNRYCNGPLRCYSNYLLILDILEIVYTVAKANSHSNLVRIGSFESPDKTGSNPNW